MFDKFRSQILTEIGANESGHLGFSPKVLVIGLSKWYQWNARPTKPRDRHQNYSSIYNRC